MSTRPNKSPETGMDYDALADKLRKLADLIETTDRQRLLRIANLFDSLDPDFERQVDWILELLKED